jgi:hypothetical protein
MNEISNDLILKFSKEKENHFAAQLTALTKIFAFPHSVVAYFYLFQLLHF